jgi:hypothetical protein
MLNKKRILITLIALLASGNTLPQKEKGANKLEKAQKQLYESQHITGVARYTPDELPFGLKKKGQDELPKTIELLGQVVDIMKEQQEEVDHEVIKNALSYTTRSANDIIKLYLPAGTHMNEVYTALDGLAEVARKFKAEGHSKESSYNSLEKIETVRRELLRKAVASANDKAFQEAAHGENFSVKYPELLEKNLTELKNSITGTDAERKAMAKGLVEALIDLNKHPKHGLTEGETLQQLVQTIEGIKSFIEKAGLQEMVNEKLLKVIFDKATTMDGSSKEPMLDPVEALKAAVKIKDIFSGQDAETRYKRAVEKVLPSHFADEFIHLTDEVNKTVERTKNPAIRERVGRFFRRLTSLRKTETQKAAKEEVSQLATKINIEDQANSVKRFVTQNMPDKNRSVEKVADYIEELHKSGLEHSKVLLQEAVKTYIDQIEKGETIDHEETAKKVQQLIEQITRLKSNTFLVDIINDEYKQQTGKKLFKKANDALLDQLTKEGGKTTGKEAKDAVEQTEHDAGSTAKKGAKVKEGNMQAEHDAAKTPVEKHAPKGDKGTTEHHDGQPVVDKPAQHHDAPIKEHGRPRGEHKHKTEEERKRKRERKAEEVKREGIKKRRN